MVYFLSALCLELFFYLGRHSATYSVRAIRDWHNRQVLHWEEFLDRSDGILSLKAESFEPYWVGVFGILIVQLHACAGLISILSR